MSFSIHQKFSLSLSQVSTVFTDQCIILNFEDGMYYQLDEVGSLIWQELEKTPLTLSELKEKVMETYDIDENTCIADIQELLKELIDEKLVELI